MKKQKLNGYAENSTEYKKYIKEIVGKNLNPIPNKKTIRQYREYSSFKSAYFKSSKNPEYKDGQIQNLYFKFVK